MESWAPRVQVADSSATKSRPVACDRSERQGPPTSLGPNLRLCQPRPANFVKARPLHGVWILGFHLVAKFKDDPRFRIYKVFAKYKQSRALGRSRGGSEVAVACAQAQEPKKLHVASGPVGLGHCPLTMKAKSCWKSPCHEQGHASKGGQTGPLSPTTRKRARRSKASQKQSQKHRCPIYRNRAKTSTRNCLPGQPQDRG